MRFIMMSECATEPGTTQHRRYGNMIEEAAFAESNGFHGWGTSDHHFFDDMCVTSAPEYGSARHQAKGVAMIVVVAADGSIQLDDSDTFTELAVDAIGLTREDVCAVAISAGAGIVEADHFWIDIDFLRNLGRGTAVWNGAFDSMVDYARRKGWTDTGGTRVRAHIRWNHIPA